MGNCGCKNYVEKINELCFPNNTNNNINSEKANIIFDKYTNNINTTLNDANKNNKVDTNNNNNELNINETKKDEITFKNTRKNDNDVYKDFFDVDKHSNNESNQVTLYPYINKSKQQKDNMETNIVVENNDNNEHMNNDDDINIPSFLNDNDLQDIVNKINILRNKHHSPNLLINKDLNKIAQLYANKLSEDSMIQPSENKYKGELLGENLYFAMDFSNKDLVDFWYNKGNNYDYNNPENNINQFGEFTQLIWKSSIYIGIGVSKSKEGYYYGVANFYPAGNISNNYNSNVLSE